MSPLVYVVDDEEKICNIIHDALTFEGYDVETFSDGRSFLATYAKRRPDLVLLDLQMPGMDGWEVIAQLREADEQAPPVLAITALLEPGKQVGPGFDAIIQKPFDLEELEQVVATHAGRTG